MTKHTAFYFLFGALIWSYLNSGTIGGNFQYIIMAALLLFLFLQYGFVIPMNQDINRYLIIVVCAQFVIPIIQFVTNGTTTVMVYAVVHIMYALTIIMIGNFVADEEAEKNVAMIFWALYGLYILYCYIQTPSNLFDFSNIQGIITNVDRTRTNYNEIHANNIGNMCAFEMMAGCLFSFEKRWQKVFKVAVYIFSTLMLISTGSRGGLVALLVFVFFLWAIRFIYRSLANYNSLMFHQIVLGCVMIIGFIILLFIMMNGVSFDGDFLNDFSSGRWYGWQACIESLREAGKLLLGFDFVNPVMLFQSGNYGRLIADNWFVYVWLTTGIAGIVLMVVMLINFGRGLAKRFRFNNFDIVLMSFFLAKIFYGLFEISLYTLSDASSLLVFGLLASRICRDDEILEREEKEI